jgi:predicted RNase H-like HicB family nuclease/uncharacterized damage-inducible protein DinB
MTVYGLHLESGPKKRKTMVHVPELLGCVAVGPTSEVAIAAAPEAIAAFRRFMHRHGEPVDLGDPIETAVVEHVTEGEWLGNGSPYLTFECDLAPLTDEDISRFLARSAALVEELAAWAATRSERQLDAEPVAGSRSARTILLHVLATQHAYFSSALGGAPGFGPIHTAAERGELPIAEALRRTIPKVEVLILATTPEQRTAVRLLTSRTYTLRKAFRRQLEHTWEHMAELSGFPDGPEL